MNIQCSSLKNFRCFFTDKKTLSIVCGLAIIIIGHYGPELFLTNQYALSLTQTLSLSIGSIIVGVSLFLKILKCSPPNKGSALKALIKSPDLSTSLLSKDPFLEAIKESLKHPASEERRKCLLSYWEKSFAEDNVEAFKLLSEGISCQGLMCAAIDAKSFKIFGHICYTYRSYIRRYNLLNQDLIKSILLKCHPGEFSSGRKLTFNYSDLINFLKPLRGIIYNFNKEDSDGTTISPLGTLIDKAYISVLPEKDRARAFPLLSVVINEIDLNYPTKDDGQVAFAAFLIENGTDLRDSIKLYHFISQAFNKPGPIFSMLFLIFIKRKEQIINAKYFEGNNILQYIFRQCFDNRESPNLKIKLDHFFSLCTHFIDLLHFSEKDEALKNFLILINDPNSMTYESILDIVYARKLHKIIKLIYQLNNYQSLMQLEKGGTILHDSLLSNGELFLYLRSEEPSLIQRLINIKDKNGESVFICALNKGNYKIAKILINEFGVILDDKENLEAHRYLIQAFLRASRYDQEEEFEQLLSFLKPPKAGFSMQNVIKSKRGRDELTDPKRERLIERPKIMPPAKSSPPSPSTTPPPTAVSASSSSVPTPSSIAPTAISTSSASSSAMPSTAPAAPPAVPVAPIHSPSSPNPSQ